MKEFSLQVLGANSAVPLPGRFPTSFVLQYDRHRFLLDCGEGSQIKMSEFHVKRSRIDHIFITHLHGDHIFGLPGLLHSFTLNRRERPVFLFGPIGLKSYIEHVFKITGVTTGYEIVFHELDKPIFVEIGIYNGLKVCAFPLTHRIPTFGYRFEEEQLPLNIIPESIEKFRLSIQEIKQLKKGQPIHRAHKKVSLSEVTYPPSVPRSFAFCTDTLYEPALIPYIRRVNCLYHEATYLEELANEAGKRMHSTGMQAARIAREAAVNQLIIGHYSGRYKELTPLLLEARSVFPNTHLALEGETFAIT